MPHVFDWIKNLGKSEPSDAVSVESGDRRTVSIAEMRSLGWIDAAQAEAGEKAMEELKAVILKSAWKLAPQFRQETISFMAPDGKVPFLLAFQEGSVQFLVCVQGIEEPVALAEIPREFKIERGGGAYRGLFLDGQRVNLKRYVSVMLNSVRLGSCRP